MAANGYAAIEDDPGVTKQPSATENADDGILTVFTASKDLEGVAEYEGFALIGGSHGREAVIGEITGAEPIETEPSVPYPATCKNITRVWSCTGAV